jgi:pimeloyl-ACP methyl ester carboxylesterase
MLQKSFLGQSALGFHNIAYTQWGTDVKPPVICVHGLTRNSRDFDRLAESLATQHHVFCPDIVGRGQSDNLADPSLYGYPQYCADMTVMIARADSAQIDWVGTSMGGIIGMLLAAQPHTPIRRLVINDVGPFIPLAALQRIAAYVGAPPEFSDRAEAETYMRKIYAPFGKLSDQDWQNLAAYGTRSLDNGKLTLAYDPAIAKNFTTLDKAVDFWNIYDRITCPTLVLRGAQSDILPADVAEAMTRRGPKARLIEIADTGHAPALMDRNQISLINGFLG